MCCRGLDRLLIRSGFLLLAGLGLVSAETGQTGVRIVTPSDIKFVPVPGYPAGYARVMLDGKADEAGNHTYRVRLPAGFTIEPHTHPADEHVTVLQGTWRLGLGESFDAARLKAIPAGSFVIIPAGTPHFLSIETETIVQVQGVGPVGMSYVSKKGRQQ
jgi:quercetin dioxygenase-like cupin family protein